MEGFFIYSQHYPAISDWSLKSVPFSGRTSPYGLGPYMECHPPPPPPLPPGYCCGLNQAKPSEQHFEYLSRNDKLLLFAFTIYHVYKIIQKKKTHINLKNLAKSFGLGPLHKEKSITAAYRPSLTRLLPGAVEICPPRSHCSKVKIRDCRFFK